MARRPLIIHADKIEDVVVAIVMIAFIAFAFLFMMNVLTDHEPPPTLPDCEKSQVLDHVSYDSDPAKRTYKCVYVDDLKGSS